MSMRSHLDIGRPRCLTFCSRDCNPDLASRMHPADPIAPPPPLSIIARDSLLGYWLSIAASCFENPPGIALACSVCDSSGAASIAIAPSSLHSAGWVSLHAPVLASNAIVLVAPIRVLRINARLSLGRFFYSSCVAICRSSMREVASFSHCSILRCVYGDVGRRRCSHASIVAASRFSFLGHAPSRKRVLFLVSVALL